MNDSYNVGDNVEGKITKVGKTHLILAVGDAERAFNLEPMDLVLRVRAIPGHPELIKVRAEKTNLC